MSDRPVQRPSTVIEAEPPLAPPVPSGAARAASAPQPATAAAPASTPTAPEPLLDAFDWPLEAVTMPQVVRQLRQPSDEPRLVVTVNAALLWMASKDEGMARIVQSAAMRVADGMGVIWSWRAIGRHLPERIAGIDLMVELIRAAAEDGRTIYLLGSKPEILEKLQEVLQLEHPRLVIAGSHHGYFGRDQDATIAADVRASGAHLLFIGMPSPEKEQWAADHLHSVGADLVMGVGGSFDVIAGFVPRAPSIMQRTGLEWAWRLACEPRRMWKRYAVTNVWLARRVVAEIRRRRRT